MKRHSQTRFNSVQHFCTAASSPVESLLVCSNQECASGRCTVKSPPAPPSPREPWLFWNEKENPWGIFRNFFFLHIRFPPCNIYQLLPKFSAKQRQIFFPQIYFPFPLTFMKGLKTVSVSFLALCTDHHQLFQAALEKKKNKLILN